MTYVKTYAICDAESSAVVSRCRRVFADGANQCSGPHYLVTSSVSSPLDGFAYRTANPFTRLRASVITCLSKMCLREWFVKLALEISEIGIGLLPHGSARPCSL